MYDDIFGDEKQHKRSTGSTRSWSSSKIWKDKQKMIDALPVPERRATVPSSLSDASDYEDLKLDDIEF